MKHHLNKKHILGILERNDTISHIKDVDSLLDSVLLEARSITRADAGSIYLLSGNKLTFEYVQNDTLMKPKTGGNKYIYSKREVEVDTNSISGYVALKRKPLLIDDVYKLGDGVPYTFNRSFDESSSYRTHSMLTVPLISSRDNVTGVLQIINARNEKGVTVPFTKEEELLVSLFANQAAVAIERARMTREIILRMIKMAELRDPKETGAHVNRVGAYSIEIYQQWAQNQGVDEKEIKRVKDILRIAAMLHDVGKVAISDNILKKNVRLERDEYEKMKYHTIFGAQLFKNSNSDWDDMAAEIALNHHERWDGRGYPGPVNIYGENPSPMSHGRKGDDIPLTARIVALADVYDALMSKRSYKESWREDEVLEYIEGEKANQFAPRVVDAFLEIYDVIKAIRGKYT